MTPEEILACCMSKPGAWADFPFDETTLVVKVGKKLFAILGEARPLRISLKCQPERVEALRAEYPAIAPGYYLSKRHWNTVTCDGSVPDDLIHELIDVSYDLVFKSLTKKEQAEAVSD